MILDMKCCGAKCPGQQNHIHQMSIIMPALLSSVKIKYKITIPTRIMIRPPPFYNL